LDVRAGPLGPEAPTQQGADRPLLGGPRGHRAPGRNRRRDPTDTAPANPRSLSENPIWVAAGVAPAGLVALTRCIPLMRANVPFAFPCAPCDPGRPEPESQNPNLRTRVSRAPSGNALTLRCNGLPKGRLCARALHGTPPSTGPKRATHAESRIRHRVDRPACDEDLPARPARERWRHRTADDSG